MRPLTTKDRNLIKRIEKQNNKKTFDDKKEMYLRQTDRNYKDGDRN